MKKAYEIIVLVVISMLMTSCSYEQISEKLIPKEESEIAKEYLSKLRNKDYSAIKSSMHSELISQVNDELLEKMNGLFRTGEPISTTIIGSHVNVINGQWQGNFTFEYQFESGWNVANAAILKVDHGYEIIGLNVHKTNMSQKELNEFKLTGKSILQYFVLVCAVIVPIFILVTLFVCARTPIQQKKWLWIIFVLMGLGALQVNWTDGTYSVKLLSAYLLGASAMSAGPSASWLLSASFPLGAMMFWIKRKGFIDQCSNNKLEDANGHDLSE